MAFQTLTGDDWCNQMYAYVNIFGWPAAIFYAVVFIFNNYVLMNMFIAVILEGFAIENAAKEEKQVNDSRHARAEVIIEEMYPFPGAPGDGGWLGPGGVAGAGALLEMYINATRPRSVGWFAFYWGEAAALGMSGAAASEYTAWLKAWGAARPW